MKKTIVSLGVILLIWLVFANVFGTSDDSLLTRIEETQGAEKADLLIQVSKSYLSVDPTKSIYYAIQALEIAKTSNDTNLIALSYLNIGQSYSIKSEPTKAQDYLQRSLKLFKVSGNEEGIAKSYNSLGLEYRYSGDFQSSLSYHLNALEIYEENENAKDIANTMNLVGDAYKSNDKLSSAIEMYNKALIFSEKENIPATHYDALINLGHLYWKDKKIDTAQSYYRQSVRFYNNNTNIIDNSPRVLNRLGKAYSRIGENKKAINKFLKSFQYSKEIGDKRLMTSSQMNIGILYKEKGQYELALQFLNEGYQIAQEIHHIKAEEKSLLHLSQTWRLIGNFENALDYYILYSNLKDSVNYKEASSKVSLMELGHKLKDQELQRSIREIDLQLKVSKEKNIRNIIIFISLIVILLAIVIWRNYRAKIKSNQELRTLNIDLERRVEERTKRLREENEHKTIAQKQAELANEAKNKFLATISHEVRTPINAIIGFCDLTIKSNIDKEHQQNLQRVKDSSAHLLALVKDVLDYSQIESGQLQLKNISFDLSDLIDSVVNAFYLDARSKDIKLSNSIDGKVPKFIIGDPGAVRQILYNLIGNALKFTDAGNIQVSVVVDDDHSSNDNVKLRFSVKDSGIGIPKIKQKLIFMDFTQEDNTSSRKYGGAGLGLTISKRFVEMMKGDIWVESEKGQGSDFIFTVNLKVDKKKAINKEEKKIPVKNELNILVAEDNMLNAQVILAFLKRLGHTAKVVGNGAEAVKILSKEEFDVVLMDIEMPEMDGLEATEVIRKGKNNIINPDIPIVALTAHALKDYEIKSFDAGMNAYLTKPIDIDQLSETLKTF